MRCVLLCILLHLTLSWCSQNSSVTWKPKNTWSELTCNQVDDTRMNCLLASTSWEPVAQQVQKNILWEDLQPCSTDPLTWRYRDGYCRADENDRGIHVVCAELTDERLHYSKSLWNDLMTPNPSSGFPWLEAGDTWCLCAARWLEAEKAGVKTRVIEEATHNSMKQYIYPTK